MIHFLGTKPTHGAFTDFDPGVSVIDLLPTYDSSYQFSSDQALMETFVLYQAVDKEVFHSLCSEVT